MTKDLSLAAEASRANGVDAEPGLRAAELYARFTADTGGAQDFSAIVTAIRTRSQEDLR